MSGRINGISLLDPTFGNCLYRLMQDLHMRGSSLHVFETIRSPERQMELYAKGRDPMAVDFGRTVTNAKAYQSAHQYGLGADVVFNVGGVWTWERPPGQSWVMLAERAPLYGLETLSFERPHVQIAGFDWKKLAPGPGDASGWMQWLAERNNKGETK